MVNGGEGSTTSSWARVSGEHGSRCINGSPPLAPRVFRLTVAASTAVRGVCLSGLVLQARIVDFWSGSRAIRRAVRLRLERLGFSVLVADECVQIGVSCGYVAARATGIMFAAGNEWLSVNVSDAAEETWISLGNALLEHRGASAAYLEQHQQHVYILAQLFHDACLQSATSAMPYNVVIVRPSLPCLGHCE
jgi:hypothetical protein